MFRVINNKGFQLELENGWTVSVMFGRGNYCDNGGLAFFPHDNNPENEIECPNAEIAAWDKDDNWYHFADQHDTVEGYNTPNEVAAFIAMIAAK